MSVFITSSKRWVFVLLTVAVLGGCGNETAWSPAALSSDMPSDAPEKVQPLQVYVVNYPLQYFAERIGGEEVEVIFPAPDDVDPAHWSPDAETVAAYQGADLVLLHGAGYEKWVERVSLPSSRLVNTSAAFTNRYISLEGATVHNHGPEGEHSHQGTAFTTWLDPTLAIEHARSVTDALVKARPAREEVFQQAFEGLLADLKILDERLTAVALSLGKEPLLFSHPVYQYLIWRHGLNGRSVHWEPSESPDDDMWRKLEELLTTHAAQYMIWEDVPLPETTRRLKTLGLESLVFAPCANVPTTGDLLSVMHRNLDELESVSSVRTGTEAPTVPRVAP